MESNRICKAQKNMNPCTYTGKPKVMNRVLNKSLRPAKFAGYFMWTHRLLFFGKYPQKAKNYVYVMFKHLNFCSRMLEMHWKRSRFQNFSKGMPPDPPSNLHFRCSQVPPVVKVFCFSTYSIAFANYINFIEDPELMSIFQLNKLQVS